MKTDRPLIVSVLPLTARARSRAEEKKWELSGLCLLERTGHLMETRSGLSLSQYSCLDSQTRLGPRRRLGRRLRWERRCSLRGQATLLCFMSTPRKSPWSLISVSEQGGK